MKEPGLIFYLVKNTKYEIAQVDYCENTNIWYSTFFDFSLMWISTKNSFLWSSQVLMLRKNCFGVKLTWKRSKSHIFRLFLFDKLVLTFRFFSIQVFQLIDQNWIVKLFLKDTPVYIIIRIRSIIILATVWTNIATQHIQSEQLIESTLWESKIYYKNAKRLLILNS